MKKLFFAPRKSAYILDLARFGLQKHLKSPIARLEDYDVSLSNDGDKLPTMREHIYVISGQASDGVRYHIEVGIKPMNANLWTAERVTIVPLHKLKFRAEFETIYFLNQRLHDEYAEKGGTKFKFWTLPSKLPRQFNELVH